jgi:menaquinone-dependent protoporphyrinogen IX oxidase
MANIAEIEEAIEEVAVEKIFRRSIVRPNIHRRSAVFLLRVVGDAQKRQPQTHWHVKWRIMQQFNWRQNFVDVISGAGDGNRTLLVCLGVPS